MQYSILVITFVFFFFQAEGGLRDLVRSRGLGDVYMTQVVIGTIRNIQQVVNEQQLTSPAIIIIGDVVQDRVILDSISREVVQV